MRPEDFHSEHDYREWLRKHATVSTFSQVQEEMHRSAMREWAAIDELEKQWAMPAVEER